jgi:metallo-beta-lactamase family protein
MRINFHGAAQTVTGSQHLLEINGHRLLLDCGLYQGRREETYARNLNFSYDPSKIDAVILSHAHIDHSGNLPNLVQDGFSGPIYATHATVDLATVMMADSGRIQESDAEFVNKKRKARGEEPIEPLYTEIDAQHAADLFCGVIMTSRLKWCPVWLPVFLKQVTFLDQRQFCWKLMRKGKKPGFGFQGI